jgi:hypothetical protein
LRAHYLLLSRAHYLLLLRAHYLLLLRANNLLLLRANNLLLLLSLCLPFTLLLRSLRRGSLDATTMTPEVLMSVGLWVAISSAVAVTLARASGWLSKVGVKPPSPDAAVAALSLATYTGLFLPTCGLVQHGMVQKGGDR